MTVVSGVAANVESERALLAVSYPNYARLHGRRADEITPALLDRRVREALLPGATDRQVAMVLQFADQLAQREGQRFWTGWEGYGHPMVQAFLGTHLPGA